jgi:hypothetical protein
MKIHLLFPGEAGAVMWRRQSKVKAKNSRPVQQERHRVHRSSQHSGASWQRRRRSEHFCRCRTACLQLDTTLGRSSAQRENAQGSDFDTLGDITARSGGVMFWNNHFERATPVELHD